MPQARLMTLCFRYPGHVFDSYFNTGHAEARHECTYLWMEEASGTGVRDRSHLNFGVNNS